MLISIRKAKGENAVEKLKGSSLPFPKHEPWKAIMNNFHERRLKNGSPSIPSIVQKQLQGQGYPRIASP